MDAAASVVASPEFEVAAAVSPETWSSGPVWPAPDWSPAETVLSAELTFPARGVDDAELPLEESVSGISFADEFVCAAEELAGEAV